MRPEFLSENAVNKFRILLVVDKEIGFNFFQSIILYNNSKVFFNYD